MTKEGVIGDGHSEKETGFIVEKSSMVFCRSTEDYILGITVVLHPPLVDLID